jgi:hypothetical protein
MFKGFNNKQQNGFPNLNFRGDISAYGFGGVSFWLDAAFGLNTQNNLGAVSYWMPRVGSSPFIQNTAGNQPRLVLNDANYNNLPSIESTGAGRFMQSTLGNLPYSRFCTIAIISKVNNAAAINSIIGLGNNGIFDGGTSVNLNGFGFYPNGTPTFQGTTETSATRIKIMSFDTIVVNGLTEFTGTNNTGTFDFNTLFRVSNTDMVGSIAEIIAYNFSMTSTQCTELSNNINSKYAIY